MEDLAGMVQRGFLSMGRQIVGTAKQSDLNTVKVDLKTVKDNVAVMKADVYTLKEDVATLKKDIADLKEDFHKIFNSLDKVAKQYADYLEERKIRDVEIARLKRWVEKIAQKVGVELTD